MILLTKSAGLRSRCIVARLEEIVAEDSQLTYQISTVNEAVTCETLDGFDAAPVAFGSDIPSLTTFGKPLLLGPESNSRCSWR